MIKRRIQVEETSIILKTDIETHDLTSFILKERSSLKNYIKLNPEFLTALEPIEVNKAPSLVKTMTCAGKIAGVGPMAAVAGTISQFCLNYLLDKGSKYSIVDNGGDVALKTNRDVTVGLFAGESSLSGRIGFRIRHQRTPMGICTSSGTVGHSISFGRADSVTVFAPQSSVADALATSLANSAQGDSDGEAVQNSLSKAEELKDHFRGVMIVVGESAGTIGKIPKLVETDKKVVLGDLFEMY
ncbi:MAG TPA: UPF0280 family protein [Methanobacteriaceae archaeon]|nr:UPF0280 family protein [Methanobacteriaceae archaeon]